MEHYESHEVDADLLMGSLERDHDRIEDYIAVLDLVLEEGEHDARGFDDALAVLADELQIHFRREEAWMRRAAYPGMGPHSEQHEMLLEALGDFRRGYQSNPSRPNALVVRSFIDDWLVDHMTHADRVIEAFVRCRTGLAVG
ncbi:MAG: hemerythrin family protein [Magnetospirillum sp. WYHS-4]